MVSPRLIACALVATVAGANVGAAQVVEPVKVDAASAGGAVFERADVQKDGAFSIVELGRSRDEHFKSGVFKSPAGEMAFDSYPEDEFCYFISGDSILTSASGKVTTFKVGEAAWIPKGWKGRWKTTGFSKFYAAYTPPEAAGSPPRK